MHNTFNVILWTSADICVVVYDDLGWKNQTTRYNCRFSAMSLALRVILVRRYMRHAWRSQTAIDYSAQNLVIWWNTSFWQHFISTNNSKLECRWSITDNYSKDSEWVIKPLLCSPRTCSNVPQQNHDSKPEEKNNDKSSICESRYDRYTTHWPVKTQPTWIQQQPCIECIKIAVVQKLHNTQYQAILDQTADTHR